MSDSLYNKIASYYVNRLGGYVGWAQQILFARVLIMYQDRIEERPKFPS
jgi:hypothetical protein